MVKALKRLLFASLLTATTLSAGNAMAATQGSLGSTSTGSATVSLTIPPVFEISGLSDLALGSYSGAAMAGNEDVCVYQNGGGAYHVLATSSTGSFQVSDGASHTIPMDVRWNNKIGTSGNTSLVYNTATAETGANITSADCSSGGKSADLQVNFTLAALQVAPAATYDATLTVVIEP